MNASPPSLLPVPSANNGFPPAQGRETAWAHSTSPPRSWDQWEVPEGTLSALGASSGAESVVHRGQTRFSEFTVAFLLQMEGSRQLGEAFPEGRSFF